MAEAAPSAPLHVGDPGRVEYFDVLIVGAGLSGIAAAYHLQTKCPAKTYAILDGRNAIGGTWDLFRYPGVRSDSEMHTLGYPFRPWRDRKAIADGSSIREYIVETAQEYGIDRKIRFGHQVTHASWSSEDAAWTVDAIGPEGKTVPFACNFLCMCSGYYDYAEGYMPGWPGMDRYHGPIVHPQSWPEDIDYEGKRIVVIGSGATAVTLVPALAKAAAHVTMLQRSPSYIVALPSEDVAANWIRRLLPVRLALRVIRFKNLLLGMYFYNLSRRRPDQVKQEILRVVQEQLGPDYDVTKHFTPRYNPWDQRLCVAPDADFFVAIRSGKGVGRHRRNRHVYRKRYTAQVRQLTTASGHHRYCDGFEVEVSGRTAGVDRRHSDQYGGDIELQGNDVSRRPELLVQSRLLQRLVDAQVQSGGRIYLPPAESHERAQL